MFSSKMQALLIFVVGILSVDCERKFFLGSLIGGSTECAQPKTVFPKESDRVIYLHIPTNFDEIVLPKDGTIILERQTDGDAGDEPSPLESDENVCQLVDLNGHRPKQLWFSTGNWWPNNAASPHVYHIPCECDDIVIPVHPPLPPIDLQFIDEIVAERITIGDRDGDFNQFLETSIGQKMFLNSEAVRYEQGRCKPQQYCGCHNHKHFEEYTALICENESANCPPAQCLEPIKPLGHCCWICGSILQFHIEDSCDFNMTKMAEVERKMNRFQNGKYVNKLEYFAGMVPTARVDKNIVQLVVTEAGEYTGISSAFMKYLTTDEHFKEDQYRKALYSGAPYIAGQTSAISIISLTFLFVASCFMAIYWHYVHEPKYDKWIPISRLNVLRKSIAFARFENRHGDDDTGRINVDIKYEEDDTKEATNGNDFDNPMYEAKPTHTIDDDDSIAQTIPFEAAVEADEPGSSANDINLVDISLDTIAD